MLWDEGATTTRKTIMQCVQPLMKVGDIEPPTLVTITPILSLLPGDLVLAGADFKILAKKIMDKMGERAG